jgi:hypothetical protein
LASNVNDIQVSSDLYAYLATSDNAAEFTVVDVWFPSSMYTVDTINIVGSNTGLDALAIVIFDSDANGIEDKAILARTGEGRVWPIDVSSPSASTLILASGYTVPGIGTAAINYLELFNANKYLALATAAATAEVVILNIETLATPSVLSTTNIAGTNNFTARGLAYAAGVDRLLAVGSRIAANANYILEIIKPN